MNVVPLMMGWVVRRGESPVCQKPNAELIPSACKISW